MEFLKYQHIERFGSVETEGIELGTCYVFSKIDGTNSSVWVDENGNIKAGSRNRELTLEQDNAGFYKWVLNQDNIDIFFCKYPNLRLFGEWLVPHTLKTYQQTAWQNFYVFDVMDGEKYLTYEEYKPLLEEFSIEYIQPICIIKNPTYEQLINQLDKATYLIEDGKGAGEGIVIKNYDYKNKFGRVTWAKIVRNEFKAQHQRCEPTKIKGAKIIEEEIAEKFITQTLVEKEYAKIVLDNNGFSSKQIPQLLNTIYYCFVKEEIWEAIKHFKNPTINFKTLQHFCIQRVKTIKPELF